MKKWQFEYLVNQIHRTAYKSRETFVVTSFLHDPELSNLQPRLQYYAKQSNDKYALIDLYYPQIRIGVEIYEAFHNHQTTFDHSRRIEIEKYLDCKIFEIRCDHIDVFEQIAVVKAEIRKQINQQRVDGLWREWKEPRSESIQNLKRTIRDTLFVKIRGHIAESEYFQRQTGTWLINWRWRPRIKCSVVVHNGEIINHFKNVTIFQDDGKKCHFHGDQENTSELIGIHVTDWNWQQTITYSDNIRN